jgi:hypothetical protein
MEGSNKLESSGAGVECSESNITLTSGEGGSLYVSGGSDLAGIGAGKGGRCASLSIENLTVESFSSSGGAGIGTSSGNSRIDVISISRSNVTVLSSGYGSGIGSGYTSEGDSGVGEIEINGSTVTARSSDSSDNYGSGIGSGHSYFGNSGVDKITIFGSSVTTSDLDSLTSYGSGIGSGYAEGSVSNSKINEITISNSTVAAISCGSSDNYGSGIGSGYALKGNSGVGEIMISNSKVTATSSDSSRNYGSGIGSGYTSEGDSGVGEIEINGSTVTATSSDSSYNYGSGIGSGYSYYGNSGVDQITIFGSSVTTSDLDSLTSYGSGIGSGYAHGLTSNSKINEIMISNSTVAAINYGSSDNYGSGIGSGYALKGNSGVGEITISNSNVSASSLGSGIGAGSGDVGTLQFSSECWIELNRSGAASAINALSIVLRDGLLTFVTDNCPLFGTSPSNLGELRMVIFYREVTPEGAERLSLLNSTFVHVGNLSLSDSELNSLRFCVRSSGYEQCFESMPRPIRGCIVSVPCAGRYWFPASANNHHENLTGSCGRSVFDIAPHYSFIDVLALVLVRYTCAFGGTKTYINTRHLRLTQISLNTNVFVPTEIFGETFCRRSSSTLLDTVFDRGTISLINSVVFGHQTHLMYTSVFPKTILQVAILDPTQDPTPEQALALRLAGGSAKSIGIGLGIPFGCVMLVAGTFGYFKFRGEVKALDAPESDGETGTVIRDHTISALGDMCDMFDPQSQVNALVDTEVPLTFQSDNNDDVDRLDFSDA